MAETGWRNKLKQMTYLIFYGKDEDMDDKVPDTLSFDVWTGLKKKYYRQGRFRLLLAWDECLYCRLGFTYCVSWLLDCWAVFDLNTNFPGAVSSCISERLFWADGPKKKYLRNRAG
jgi:hypothetical protein